MNHKILKLFLECFLVVCLSACGKIEFSKNRDNNQLTVTKIHDTVVLNQTTKEALVKQFGQPDQEVTDPSKTETLFRQDNETEGGILDWLDDETDFYKTRKSVKHDYDYSDGWDYDNCYIYQDKNLGVEYVRFYIKDGLVGEYYFGDITNKSIAKKDKYLRQIID
ncbi:hypothetical protein [Streptococcus ferus]|uniref:hypothetical protein n=1 Tax=Streptococcus ferus TaxID=1345 RepID=UPI0023579B5A|nr:hypothetical protein [Streptococcus ferus]